jgi:hypothetical protein
MKQTGKLEPHVDGRRNTILDKRLRNVDKGRGIKETVECKNKERC